VHIQIECALVVASHGNILGVHVNERTLLNIVMWDWLSMQLHYCITLLRKRFDVYTDMCTLVDPHQFIATPPYFKYYFITMTIYMFVYLLQLLYKKINKLISFVI
jgi:hypothetical protein